MPTRCEVPQEVHGETQLWDLNPNPQEVSQVLKHICVVAKWWYFTSITVHVVIGPKKCSYIRKEKSVN